MGAKSSESPAVQDRLRPSRSRGHCHGRGDAYPDRYLAHDPEPGRPPGLHDQELISKAISMLGQMLVADEDAGDPEHGQEGGGLALPAHVQPAVGAQPGDRALDLVPVPPSRCEDSMPGRARRTPI